MSVSLVSARLASAVSTSPAGVEQHAKARTGHYHGQTVQSSSDKHSQLARASRKQINSQVAEKMNLQRLVTLSKRIGQGSHAEATARIAEFYDKLPNLPGAQELARFIEDVRAFQEEFKAEAQEDDEAGGVEGERDDEDALDDGASAKSRRESARQAISSALEQFDSDVSHQFAALEILLEDLEDEQLDPQFQAALDDVSKFFEDGDIARDVRAGLAAGKAAQAAAATLGVDPAAVRETYRALIRQEANYAKLFDSLMKYDPLANSDAVFDTFCAAAGNDLANLTGPSTDPSTLRALLLELGKLKKLRAVFDGCGKLASDIESALQETPQAGMLKPSSLATRLLAFIGRSSVSINDSMALLGELAKAKAGAKLIFFNGVEYLLVLVPDDLFPNMDARLVQKKALRMANEKIVEEEEEEFRRDKGIKSKHQDQNQSQRQTA